MNEQEAIKQYGQVVAKAWSDPAFKQQLLADPAGTLRGEGFDVPAAMRVRVLEPSGPCIFMQLPTELPVGEQPSEWVTLVSRAQTEPAFKARLLAEPATVLAEQGIGLPENVPVEVVEVSDTQGYIAVPPAPEGLDADSLDDVVGYFTCVTANPDALPQRVQVAEYTYMGNTRWEPIWASGEGAGRTAALRPFRLG